MILSVRSRRSGLGGALRAGASSGLGGALRAGASSGLGGALRAPLGPVVAPLASSLRTPSRPHPPLEDALRAMAMGLRAILTFFAIGGVRDRLFCAIGQPMVSKVAGQWAGTPKALG